MMTIVFASIDTPSRLRIPISAAPAYEFSPARAGTVADGGPRQMRSTAARTESLRWQRG